MEELSYNKNRLTGNDVKVIYEKVEKSKKGTFYIDSSKKTSLECPPNHIDERVAAFLEQITAGKIDDAILKEDGKITKMLIDELVNG